MHSHQTRFAAPARGARFVCRASRTIAVRVCRTAARGVSDVCSVQGRACRTAGRWSRVVASGSTIPTGVARAAHWPDAAPETGAQRPRRVYREPLATTDYASSSLRRSVARSAELRRDPAPADTAASAVSVTGAVHGPLALARHTGGTAPGTMREHSTACRVCGGMCAAVIRPGAACPRKGVTRR